MIPNKNFIIPFVIVALAMWTRCKSRESSGQGTEKRPPNIVLFFVDDLGWSDLGFRNSTFESPNIDNLSKAGINFEQAYIACPTCSPSRGTLLTGKHPARLKLVRHIPGGPKFGFDKFGRTDNEFNYLETDPAQFPCRNWLPLQHVTYAEALKDCGYYNLFVGKWHLGYEKYHPVHQGFDRQIGASNFGHPHSYYPPYFRNSDVFSDEQSRYLTDKLTDETVQFIESYDREQPFMISFWYYSVHSPHEGRKDLVDHFEKKGLEGKMAQYAAMVKATDESIGRVLDAINDKGIDKETIIIFLSDQGGYFENPPFRGGKMGGTALYEGGARVPFFFHWPGVTEADVKNGTVVQSTDLFPTLVEIAGGRADKYKDLDGESLVPLIKENNSLQRDAIFAYRVYEDLYVSMRSGDWKLLAYRSGKLELYNIAEDIQESNNLVDQHPEKVKSMVKKLVAWEKEMGVERYSGIKE